MSEPDGVEDDRHVPDPVSEVVGPAQPGRAAPRGQVRLRDAGPMVVTGDVHVRHTGEGLPVARIEQQGRGNVALCRCGGSAIHPLCDGTHRGRVAERRTGGAAPPAATQESCESGGAPGVDVRTDGRIVVRGWPVHLHDGSIVDQACVVVCGCGQSGDRPWCDGRGCAGV